MEECGLADPPVCTPTPRMRIRGHVIYHRMTSRAQGTQDKGLWESSKCATSSKFPKGYSTLILQRDSGTCVVPQSSNPAQGKETIPLILVHPLVRSCPFLPIHLSILKGKKKKKGDPRDIKSQALQAPVAKGTSKENHKYRPFGAKVK